MQTYVGLSESYHILVEKQKCLNATYQAMEIRDRIGTKDELFDIMAHLKISQNEEVKDVDESIKKLDALIERFDHCKIIGPQKRQYIININNQKKNIYYHANRKLDALKVLEHQLEMTKNFEVQYQ